MTGRFDLLIRKARDARGRGTSIGIREGRIAAIGPDGGGKGPEYDARGRTVGAGLHDHHLHLLATAARMQSVDLSACRTADDAIARLRAKAGPPGRWVRAIGHDQTAAGLPGPRPHHALLPQPPRHTPEPNAGT